MDLLVMFIIAVVLGLVAPEFAHEVMDKFLRVVLVIALVIVLFNCGV